MQYDIQKAGIWRRIATGLFDIILLVVLATGLGWGISAIIGIDTQIDAMNQIYDQYAEEYNIDFTMGEADFATMPSEDQERYNAAIDAMNKDDSAYFVYLQVINSILVMISLSVLLAHLILEFAVPLILKNGQTVGKKIFGIALMRKDGIMITPFTLFVRSILGKCTLEIMLPLLILFMTILGTGGIFVYLVLALGIAQVMLLFLHPHNAVIHDLLACTVAVDMSSQLIFKSPEALLAYQKERAAEKAKNQEY